MKPIEKKIQDTQNQVQQTGQQLQQMVQQREQLNQAITQGEFQYNTLVANLNTLQEVAGAGADLFRDEEAQAAAETTEQADASAVSAEKEVTKNQVILDANAKVE